MRQSLLCRTTWSARYTGYDLFGRVTSKTNALQAQILRLTYDLNGRLTNRWTLAKGNTAFAYDAVGSLTNIGFSATSGSPASISFRYDKAQRLTNIVDASGTNGFSWTGSGLLLTEDGPWPSDSVINEYGNGLRESQSIQHPTTTAWVSTNLYDGLQRLQTVVSPIGNFDYRYLPSGGAISPASDLIQRINLPNGAYQTNLYSNLGQLTKRVLNNSGNARLGFWEADYDAAGQKLWSSRQSKLTRSYLYDNIGQLTNVTTIDDDSGAPYPLEQFSYQYDTAGNLSWRTKNVLTNVFTCDALNQLSNITRSGTLTVGGYVNTGVCAVAVNGQAALLYPDLTYAAEGVALNDGNNTLIAIAEDGYGRRARSTNAVKWPALVKFVYFLEF